MKFTCPHCGKGSFMIVKAEAGSQFATCNNCGKQTPFDRNQMADAKMTPSPSRRLHLK